MTLSENFLLFQNDFDNVQQAIHWQAMYQFTIKHLKILGNESFTRWLVEAPEHESVRKCESITSMFNIPMSLSEKSSNEFDYNSLGSSIPPPISAQTNQTTLRD